MGQPGSSRVIGRKDVTIIRTHRIMLQSIWAYNWSLGVCRPALEKFQHTFFVTLLRSIPASWGLDVPKLCSDVPSSTLTLPLPSMTRTGAVMRKAGCAPCALHCRVVCTVSVDSAGPAESMCILDFVPNVKPISDLYRRQSPN